MSENSDRFNETDVGLAARLKNLEDREAWEQFFQEHSEAIYGAMRKAGLDETTALDLVMSTFIAATKALPGVDYDPARGSLRSWLMQIAQCRVREYFRKQSSGECGDSSSASET